MKDEKCLGYPQVVVHFSDNKIVVTDETGWEPMFKDEFKAIEDGSALKSVIQALGNQLNNIHGQLLSTEKQISLRQSIFNRSLAALNDAIAHRGGRVQAVSKIKTSSKSKHFACKFQQQFYFAADVHYKVSERWLCR